MNPERPCVLITGGAKRLGAVLVRTFARSGCRVLIHYNTSEAESASLLAEIGGPAEGHGRIRADLSTRSGVLELAAALPAGLNVLINNASVFVRETASLESYDHTLSQFQVNFLAPVELMKAFFRNSRAEDRSIVNILDGGSTTLPADSFSYALSKNALADATRLAARQFAPFVRVNGVAAGPCFPPPGWEDKGMKKTLSTLPLGRPADKADLAELCRTAAFCRSMTGAILHCDCGRSLE